MADVSVEAVPEREVGQKEYRDAMCRLAAAVHVVTTAGPAGASGFTATAVTSVSDSPPTLLVCLNRSSQIAPLFRANRVFCVNTLAAGQEEVADVFAGRTGVFMDARFKTGQWSAHRTGAPRLHGAVVAFDCELMEVKEVATHDILIGRVVGVTIGEEPTALTYFDRCYRSV